MSYQNSYIVDLTPSVLLFGDEVSNEVIKFNWGHEGGAPIWNISVHIRRDIPLPLLFLIEFQIILLHSLQLGDQCNMRDRMED